MSDRRTPACLLGRSIRRRCRRGAAVLIREEFVGLEFNYQIIDLLLCDSLRQWTRDGAADGSPPSAVDDDDDDDIDDHRSSRITCFFLMTFSMILPRVRRK